MDQPLFDGELVHSRRLLYTPSPFARSSLLHLQEAGNLQARAPHASARQGLASYLVFLVEQGSGTLTYAGARHDLQAGDCAFLDCRIPYEHRTGQDLWRLRWAHFYGPNMGAIYKKYQDAAASPLSALPAPNGTAPCCKRSTIPPPARTMCATCACAANCLRC